MQLSKLSLIFYWLIALITILLFIITLYIMSNTAIDLMSKGVYFSPAGVYLYKSIMYSNLYKSLIFLPPLILIAFIFSQMKCKLSIVEHPLLPMFILAFFFGVLFWNLPEGNSDFVRYFLKANYLANNGVTKFVENWGNFYYTGSDLPSIIFLFGLIFKFFGDFRMNIQIFTTALYALTVILTYLIGSKLWNKEVGITAGFLLMFFPFYICQVPLMLVDVSSTFFLTLSFFLFIHTLEFKKGKNWFILLLMTAIIIVFTLFSKYTLIIFLPPTLFALIVLCMFQANKKDHRKETLLKTGMIFVLIFLLTLVVIFQKLEVFSSQFLHYLGLGGEFTSINMSSNVILELFRTILLQGQPLFYMKSSMYLVGGWTTILALLSIYILVRKRDYLLILPIVWGLVPILLLPLGRYRYLMPAFPAFALGAAVVISKISDINLRKFLVCCIIISSIVMTVFIFVPLRMHAGTVNVKSATDYINRMEMQNIALVHIGETEHGKMLVRYRSTIIAMFQYHSNKNVIYYTPKKIQQNTQNVPKVLILVNDKLDTAHHEDLNQFLADSYNLVKVFNDGYFGVWSPLVCKIYVPK